MFFAELQSIAIFLPYIFLWGFFLTAGLLFFKTKNNREKLRHWSVILLWSAVGFRIFYAGFLTVGQYIFWGSDAKTKIFLDQGIDINGPLGGLVKLFPFLGVRFGYFIFYSFIHFWAGALLAILCAVLFWWFLKVLHKYRERFFEEGEKELGALMALLAGWPGFIPFLFIAILAVVVLSLVRSIFYKESYTTFGLPFLFAALFVLLVGKIFLAVTGLSVLQVTNISL